MKECWVTEPAEENGAKKVKNVNLNGQKAQEYEEM